MIRELGTNYGKNIPAQYTAAVAMTTGMGVQVDAANNTVILPAAATADNIYFLEKERVAEGIYAGVANLGDYFEQFVNVKAGEHVKIIPALAGELYAVDQFASAVVADDKGKRLAVGTDGKWAVAGSTVASRFEFEGFYTDGSHKLAMIRVLDTAAANAE